MTESEDNSYELFKHALRSSRVVAMPKNNISTFGNTVYNYYHVGKISEKQTQVREGHIKIKRPLFVTPFNTEANIFKGFSGEYEEMAKKFIGDIKANPLIFVEYQFEHMARHDWIEKTPSPILLSEIKSLCTDQFFSVLITSKPEFWNIAIMKFCLKIIDKSVPINLSEIEERGFFDKNRISPQLRKKVDELFSVAEQKKSQITSLGDFLVENKIFDLYEERFFTLMEKSKKSAQ